MEGSYDTSHYGTPYAMNANLSERLLVGPILLFWCMIWITRRDMEE